MGAEVARMAELTSGCRSLKVQGSNSGRGDGVLFHSFSFAAGELGGRGANGFRQCRENCNFFWTELNCCHWFCFCSSIGCVTSLLYREIFLLHYISKSCELHGNVELSIQNRSRKMLNVDKKTS